MEEILIAALDRMGKQRGFKPQGMDNPLLLGRSEQSEPSGPSIEDRIAERYAGFVAIFVSMSVFS